MIAARIFPRRLLLGTGLLLLAGGLGGCAGPASAGRYRDRVFQLECRSELRSGVGDATRRGSAFAIDPPGYLLTCAHNLFEGAGSSVVLRSAGRRWEAEVVAVHGDLDLALLRCRSQEPRPLGFAEVPPAAGAELVALGYPIDASGVDEVFVARGTLGAASPRLVLEIGGRSRVYRGLLSTGAPIVEGWSGGPVVDGEGQVVGMLVLAAGAAGTRGEGFALAAGDLQAALADWWWLLGNDERPALRAESGARTP